MSKLWGIDLGGTKIEGVVLPDPESIEPICRLRVPTEADQGYEHILGQIGRLLDQMIAATGERPEVVGVGTPGVIDPVTGRMKNSNTTCLNGMPLDVDLAAWSEHRYVFANDANCFALAEATLGAGKGSATVFGVIMGTGVGGGVVVNGQVLGGAQGIAGEWGHNVLDPDGFQCYCGRSGCVETVLSGPALQRWHTKQTGTEISLPEIVRLAESGDSGALATLEHLYDRFGEGISVVVNILDPQAVVLGGGVSNVPGLVERGRAALAKYVFNSRVDTQILAASLGDSAGVFGAAMLTHGAKA